MKEVTEIIRNFLKDRPVLQQNNQDQEQMMKLLKAEIDEYEQETETEAKARELADILVFVISMSILSGVDLEAEVREKMARNHLKREAVLWQSGNYYESDKQARQSWKDQKGEEWFYAIPRD